MADEVAAAPASEAAVEAPASEFSLEAAFKEASAQATTDTAPPKADAPDSKATTDAPTETDTEQPAGEEPAKSNRQAGKEAYERGLREGREAAQREVEHRLAEQQATERVTSQQREFEALLQKAQTGDLAATDQVISLLSSHRATQAALLQGRNALLTEMGAEMTQSISQLDGADADARTALMQAPSVTEFGKRAFDHGRRIEKAAWEPEIAKRDATIEELRGKLAARSPSPESANGLRTGGATTFDGTWESAFALARAQAAS